MLCELVSEPSRSSIAQTVFGGLQSLQRSSSTISDLFQLDKVFNSNPLQWFMIAIWAKKNWRYELALHPDIHRVELRILGHIQYIFCVVMQKGLLLLYPVKIYGPIVLRTVKKVNLSHVKTILFESWPIRIHAIHMISCRAVRFRYNSPNTHFCFR